MELVHEEMQTSGLTRICAETRASNAAMQKVFDDCGYKLSSVVENGYDNPQEDEYKYVYEHISQ
jgi:ribosomal-protein-alanine N-acetyltransferase